MKALISPNEIISFEFISSWTQTDTTWIPVRQSIDGCTRIADVAADDAIFEVADPLYWVECPDECNTDKWYYKDNQFLQVPDDEPMPTAVVVELP
jgi:hypothetical protein